MIQINVFIGHWLSSFMKGLFTLLESLEGLSAFCSLRFFSSLYILDIGLVTENICFTLLFSQLCRRVLVCWNHICQFYFCFSCTFQSSTRVFNAYTNILKSFSCTFLWNFSIPELTSRSLTFSKFILVQLERQASSFNLLHMISIFQTLFFKKKVFIQYKYIFDMLAQKQLFKTWIYIWILYFVSLPCVCVYVNTIVFLLPQL